MILERTDEQIVIRISSEIDKIGFQKVIEYLNYLELTSKTKATQDDADKLADELNENWWAENRKSFIN
ncbi:MAG: hypothetical protein RO257_10460 [Candidatus Kapabacteria bacterium]|jgi:hypothetical protein|nr:hypothetical protein [Candidatus Kapabacteria bacterium]